ncbi:carbohydrate-binding protein [Persicobacter psychrovividus]|uniref:CBM6 domain-containing protein n=1 Tax=Persicobacter psychrovividus TaxID=387638 RepID=A0ABM7VLS7_9BACT|nr:hypothetical protein PEPS_42340 [Persicobacter psychrovividus]
MKDHLKYFGNSFYTLIVCCLLLISQNVYGQITVNSLLDLQPYLKQSNVSVKLAPGTYAVTADDVIDGRIGSYWSGSEHLGNTYNLFLFEGNNSTYDFTDVTINVSTMTAQSAGRVDFHEIRIIGNQNTIQNLTMVDDGSEHDAPSFRATNIVMDGEQNLLEGCHFTVKGSYPYGYGDIFGKGGSNIISHQKRSACLIRGNSNKVKDCTFICRNYGHGIFFQGANDPMVEGCFVEGELRKVSEVLAEDGTGSPADNVDFETIFGFNLRDVQGDYYFSLQEAGIRSYNAGETVIDGVEYSRGVVNATILNCRVEKMRTGVSIGWAQGFKYVENSTMLGCETAYWIGGDSEIVNCKGDASVGALLSEDVGRSNSKIELTLLDNFVEPLDGEVTAVYYAGSGHEVVLNDATSTQLDNIDIVLGGKRLAHRFLEGSTSAPLNYAANNLLFINNTKYPVYVGNQATGLTIESCSEVIDDGTSTTVLNTEGCTYNVALSGTASQSSTGYGGLAAYAIDGNTAGNFSHGSVTHTAGDTESPWWQVELARNISVGEIVIYNRTDNCCKSRLSNYTVSVLDINGNVVFSQDNNGTPDPSLIVDAGGVTGRTVKIQINGTGTLSLAEVQVFQSDRVYVRVEAEDYVQMNGIQAQTTTDQDGGENVGWINDGDWMDYEVEIPTTGTYNLHYRIASLANGGDLSLLVNGQQVDQAVFGATGGWQNWQTVSSVAQLTEGKNTLRVYSNRDGWNFNWFEIDNLEENNQRILSAESLTGVKLYPNPVIDKLHLSNNSGASMKIYSPTGVLLMDERNLPKDATLDLSGISSGLIYVNLVEGQKVRNYKIIKK